MKITHWNGDISSWNWTLLVFVCTAEKILLMVVASPHTKRDGDTRHAYYSCFVSVRIAHADLSLHPDWDWKHSALRMFHLVYIGSGSFLGPNVNPAVLLLCKWSDVLMRDISKERVWQCEVPHGVKKKIIRDATHWNLSIKLRWLCCFKTVKEPYQCTFDPIFYKLLLTIF